MVDTREDGREARRASGADGFDGTARGALSAAVRVARLSSWRPIPLFQRFPRRIASVGRRAIIAPSPRRAHFVRGAQRFRRAAGDQISAGIRPRGLILAIADAVALVQRQFSVLFTRFHVGFRTLCSGNP